MSHRRSSFRSRSRARQLRLEAARKQQGGAQPRSQRKSPFSMEMFGGMALLFIVCTSAIALIQARYGGKTPPPPLVVHCTSTFQESVLEALAACSMENISLKVAPSATLLSSIQKSGSGGLLLLEGSYFLDAAESAGLMLESRTIANLTPVLVVDQGNPHEIEGLADLAREDLRVSLGDVELTSIGRATKAALMAQAAWEAVESAVDQRGAFKLTERDLAQDVLLGLVDATVLWKRTAERLAGPVEVLELEELHAFSHPVILGVLRGSVRKDETLALLNELGRFLEAGEKHDN